MNATLADGPAGGEVKPEWTCFLGMIMYFGFALAVIPEMLESEEFREAASLREFEYGRVPVYQAAGVLVGLASYALAFELPTSPSVQLTHYAHTFLTAVVFYMLAKHLTKLAELSPRRASMVVSLGMLPLVCKSVLEAESLRVHSCSSFFALMIGLVLLPVFMVMREFRAAPANKYRKRLLMLFFALVCYFTTLTPRTLCQTMTVVRSDFAKNAAFIFDVALLLIPNLDA